MIDQGLSLHYAFLEANALATEFDPDAIEDQTLPSYDMIHEVGVTASL